jgi:hypothetical protein
MQQWETTSVSTSEKEDIDTLCKRMGAEGWEPWAVKTWRGIWAATYVYFKRPKVAE